ncbi:MAG: DegV family protein [Gemmatimonadota bacterium]
MRIAYLDGARLRRALLAGCDHVQGMRGELNRINVFPVPDGDTGTNLGLTAAALAEHLRPLRERHVGIVARGAAEAAIVGARGNCGMILSHFLLGFADSVGERSRLRRAEFAAALQDAVTHVYRALEQPVEGTIVTVMRAVADEARAAPTHDFEELLGLLLRRAHLAVESTPELLPALREAGVVDAGAKGFFHMVEGVVRDVRGDPAAVVEAPRPSGAALDTAAARVTYDERERFRFCTEALVRGTAAETRDVQAALHGRGDSLIVIRSSDILKVHIHTDDPEDVFTYLRTLGRLVTHKAEDMAAQHAAVARANTGHVRLARRPLSLVTDSGCDLPAEILRAHGIRVVPLTLVFEHEVLLDGVDIHADAFVERLRRGEHPGTSQPSPAAFAEAFRGAAEDGEAVLAVLLAASLSGTFRSACAAAGSVAEAPIHLVDSRGASLTEGLLVLRAAELAELGWAPQRIAAELERIRDRSGILFTVDVFDNLLASGRVGRGKVVIAGLLDLKPVLGLRPDGTVARCGQIRGGGPGVPRIMGMLAERIPADARALRFGVMHVGRPEIVPEVCAALEKNFGAREVITAPASPVLATHLGPGAWGVAYQVED